MGFRFKKVSFTGGASNFPVGTTQENLRTKAESIVKGVVQALIDLNLGWGLDSSRSTSITDFVEVPVVTDTRTYPGLFLKNSVSGNKLFICYIASTKDSYGIYTNANYSQLFGVVTASSTTPSHTGLIMSMIPGNANQSFGDSFGASFLPSSATRLIGTSAYTTANTAWAHNVAYRAASGNTYMFGIWATEYCIMVSCLTNLIDAWRHTIAYAVGRILFSLSNDSDTTPTARYGVVQFGYPTISESDTDRDSEMRRVIGRQNTQLLATSTTKNKYFAGLTTHIAFTHYTTVNPTDTVTENAAYAATCQIFSASGGVINNTSTTTVTYMPINYCMLAETVTQSNSCRWTPFIVYVYAEDLSTNGVVSGDGVKGLLDTDLFRCSSTTGYTSQTDIVMYDNGNFVQYLYNILLGWNPDNESLT